MKALTIGQVARNAGIGIETVPFYEREGLPANSP
jgi:DNA-binding transcriptional MerR regulator